jgi:hypothetical protein
LLNHFQLKKLFGNNEKVYPRQSTQDKV